jgi:hypothetical protein
VLLYQKNKERLDNMELKYDFKFDWETHFIETIKDAEWNIVFSSEWWKYRIKIPYDLYATTINNNRNKEEINKWLFIISWTDIDGSTKDIFLNLNDWEYKKIEFSDYAWYTFLNWNTIKHFISSHDSVVYNVNWEKLGETAYSLNNEHVFQIVKSKWKLQLVENKTWEIKQQLFDKILNRYDNRDTKVIIVENEWEVLAINIVK